MSFVLPSFNVPIKAWHNPAPFPTVPPVGPADVSVMANVSLGRRVLTGSDAASTHDVRSGVGIDVLMRQVMVPAGTDIRGIFQNFVDLLEIPAGTGAYYQVLDVADIAKGFANEHRMVWAIPISDGINFLPVPLP